MKQEKKILFFLIYWILYSGLISLYIIQSPIISFIPDLLVLYLAFRVKWNGKSLRKSIGNIIPGIMILFLLSTIFGAILNIEEPINYLWGVRNVLRYAILFVAILQIFDVKDLEKCKRIFKKAYKINVLLVAIQYFVFHLYGDFCTGSFTSNYGITLLCFISLFIYSGDFFTKRLRRWNMLFVVICQFVIALFCEIKLFYFIVPLLLYSTYVLYRRFNIKHILVLVVLYLFLIPTLTFVIERFTGDKEYASKVFDSEAIQEETTHSYGFEEGGFNRSTAIELTNMIFLYDTPHLLFGYGIGNCTASSLIGSFFFKQYSFTTYHYFTTSYVLTEVGWIGFSLLAVALILLVIRYWHIYRVKHDIHTKYWSVIGLLSCLTTFIMTWYSACVYIDYYMFFILWAMCFVGTKNYYEKV